jgi:RNA recognition motif-containing protein
MNIHIANLPREYDEAAILKLVGEHGKVGSVHVVPDKVTGKPAGFAFVEMPEEEEGKAAIAALHGKKIGDYKLSLIEVVPEEDGGSQKPGTGKWKKRSEGGFHGSGKKGSHQSGPYHGSTVRRGGQRGQ